MSILRPGLLDGRSVALSGAVELGPVLEALGARVELLEDVSANEDAVGGRARELGPIDALVHDAGVAFGAGGADRLRAALEQAWTVVRELAVAAMIESGGKVVLIAPAPGAGPLAEAARAGLENLARTLSVEWARHGITVVTIAPADAPDLSEIVAYLVSFAGDYFSGCRLEPHG